MKNFFVNWWNVFDRMNWLEFAARKKRTQPAVSFVVSCSDSNLLWLRWESFTTFSPRSSFGGSAKFTSINLAPIRSQIEAGEDDERDDRKLINKSLKFYVWSRKSTRDSKLVIKKLFSINKSISNLSFFYELQTLKTVNGLCGARDDTLNHERVFHQWLFIAV